MNVSTPHYLLYSGSSEQSEPGRWRFVLRAADGSQRMTADDVEPNARGDRLELLAVVRGLEALDQPSRVTLITPSRYVRTGIRRGLMEWRSNGWRWEYFGQMVPVKNCDLWQRVDRALRFHELECGSLRFDLAHKPFPGAPATPGPGSEGREGVAAHGASATTQRRRLPGGCHGLLRWCRARKTSAENVGGAWRQVLGLGKLFGLVKLSRGNRLGAIQPAGVCKEV